MDQRHTTRTGDAETERSSDDLAQLLQGPLDGAALGANRTRIAGAVVGTLVGFSDAGATPLVTYGEQPGPAALPARTTIDLQGAHVGRRAVLMFDEGDPCRPIIVGCLLDPGAAALPEEHVEVEADGQRLLVSAKERIVLRCGKASITLTKEGKLILQGEYVSSQSSGVLRMRGGSVHIN